jgi:hypothetical protein
MPWQMPIIRISPPTSSACGRIFISKKKDYTDVEI